MQTHAQTQTQTQTHARTHTQKHRHTRTQIGNICLSTLFYFLDVRFAHPVLLSDDGAILAWAHCRLLSRGPGKGLLVLWEWMSASCACAAKREGDVLLLAHILFLLLVPACVALSFLCILSLFARLWGFTIFVGWQSEHVEVVAFQSEFDPHTQSHTRRTLPIANIPPSLRQHSSPTSLLSQLVTVSFAEEKAANQQQLRCVPRKRERERERWENGRDGKKEGMG